MRRFARLALLALLAAATAGCGGGYLHSHSHICPNGAADTHRHYHNDSGGWDHHRPDPNWRTHRETVWDE